MSTGTLPANNSVGSNLTAASGVGSWLASSPAPVLSGNIADKLFEKGAIDGEQLKKIKFEALNSGKPIEEIILQGNYVNSEKLTEAKAELFKMPFINISGINISLEVLNRI